MMSPSNKREEKFARGFYHSNGETFAFLLSIYFNSVEFDQGLGEFSSSGREMHCTKMLLSSEKSEFSEIAPIF
ncbi:hypothetical protein AK966_08640 [Vibrio sp. PID23_8]|nr:hypothetical protein AK966_08640 [Vibrio sp. PID23_8]